MVRVINDSTLGSKIIIYIYIKSSLVAQMVKNLAEMQET